MLALIQISRIISHVGADLGGIGRDFPSEAAQFAGSRVGAVVWFVRVMLMGMMRTGTGRNAYIKID
jgi:hypothetical protein